MFYEVNIIVIIITITITITIIMIPQHQSVQLSTPTAFKNTTSL